MLHVASVDQFPNSDSGWIVLRVSFSRSWSERLVLEQRKNKQQDSRFLSDSSFGSGNVSSRFCSVFLKKAKWGYLGFLNIIVPSGVVSWYVKSARALNFF
jgi:hypothetical protein